MSSMGSFLRPILPVHGATTVYMGATIYEWAKAKREGNTEALEAIVEDMKRLHNLITILSDKAEKRLGKSEGEENNGN